MKYIFSMTMLSLLSLSAIAETKLCKSLTRALDGTLNPSVLRDENDGVNVNVLGFEYEVSPDAYLIKERGMEALEIQACKKSFTVAYFQIKGQTELLKAYMSTEDQCDGGNTLGVVRELTNGTTVASINDSAIECD